MPNWKKVATSGSAASFSSLSVDTSITASTINASEIAVDGSLQVTGSTILSGSIGTTVFSSNIDTMILTGSLVVTGSIQATGSLEVQGGITGSLFGTASYALTASYAANAAVVLTGSNAILSQSVAAATWSFNHNLNNQYPVFQVFDSNNNVVIPQTIEATSTTTATIYFPTEIAGTAVASIGGYTGSVTASYVLSASYATTADTASYVLNAVSSSHAITASYALYAETASYATQFNVASGLTASGLIYPTTDGTYPLQVLVTDGAGVLSFDDVHTLFEDVYNGEATTLTKGTLAYVSGAQGSNPKVYRADASNASKMPVTYVIAENIGTAAIGRGVTLGLITGIDLSAYAVGTELYADGNGTLTATRPTGSADIIQPIGIVTKTGNGGQLNVLNPGPVLLPNIQTGYTWIGGANNQPVSVSTSSLLVATASRATSAATASYVVTALTASYVTTAQTASYVLNAVSASRATSAATATTASYALTASYATNFTVSGTLTGYNYIVTDGQYIRNSNQSNANGNLYLDSSNLYIRRADTGANLMFVSSSGNVGIGTTSPSQKLEVVGGEIKAGRVDSTNEGGQVSFGRASDNNTTWYVDTYGSSSSPELRFVNVDNALVAMSLTGSKVLIGTGDNNLGKLQVGSGIGLNGSISNLGTGTGVYTQTVWYNDTSNQILFENARQTDSASGTGRTVYFTWRGGPSVGGGVQLQHGTNAWAAYTSDARLKTKVADIENGVDAIMKLNPIKFKWSRELENSRTVTGFTAQNVEEAIPDAVFNSWQDEQLGDVKSYYQDYLVPYLVKAIQEQQATIQELTTRLTALENK